MSKSLINLFIGNKIGFHNILEANVIKHCNIYNLNIKYKTELYKKRQYIATCKMKYYPIETVDFDIKNTIQTYTNYSDLDNDIKFLKSWNIIFNQVPDEFKSMEQDDGCKYLC